MDLAVPSSNYFYCLEVFQKVQQELDPYCMDPEKKSIETISTLNATIAMFYFSNEAIITFFS